MRVTIPGQRAFVDIEFDDWIIRAAKSICLVAVAAIMFGIGRYISSFEWERPGLDPTLIGAGIFFVAGVLHLLAAWVVWRGKPLSFRIGS